ncbi:MAG: corrinoid protein [Candidatus Methanomethylophilaceae archaeon]|nr:corrinoid protein [Candidatus Methanomethylophilaceae archaeon]
MTKDALLARLADAVISGKPDLAKEGAHEVLKNGVSPMAAINEGLVKGMSVVGDRYAAHEVYLPQVLMSAHTMYAGLDILLPAIPKEEVADKKKVIIGVVEGDVHDIGKNIVKTMMTAGGFEVLDMGRDVPISTFIESSEKEKVDVVAMSTLMTPTMDGMKEVIDGLKESGYRSKVQVIIGGPPTSPTFAKEIGADHRDANAQDSVANLKGVFK